MLFEATDLTHIKLVHRKISERITLQGTNTVNTLIRLIRPLNPTYDGRVMTSKFFKSNQIKSLFSFSSQYRQQIYVYIYGAYSIRLIQVNIAFGL